MGGIIEVLKTHKMKIPCSIKVHLSGDVLFILCYCPFKVPSRPCQAVPVSIFPFVIFPLESHFHSFKVHLSAIIVPKRKAVWMREPKLATDAETPRTTALALELRLKAQPNHEERKTLQIMGTSRTGEQQWPRPPHTCQKQMSNEEKSAALSLVMEFMH